MADHEHDEPTRDQGDRRRIAAQDTVAELARMGIDPRALGLSGGAHRDSPGQRWPIPQQPPTPEHALDPIGSVVPLRPEFDRPTLPASGTSRAWAPEPPRVERAGDSAAAPADVEMLFAGARPGRTRSIPTHLARSITFGLLTPDAAESADREREMVSRIKIRIPEPQSTVFLSGKGGVGVTTVTLAVGSVFAALRDDTACMATVRYGAPSLGLALTGRQAIGVRDLARANSDAEPTRLPSGLRIVEGPDWSAPLRRSDVPTVMERIQQTAQVALYDVGNDTGEAAESVLGRTDQIVVVTSAAADGLAALGAAVERVTARDPMALDAAVFVVVCHQPAGLKRVVRRMREALPHRARVVAVPPDDYLADGGPFDPAKLAYATRQAFLDVAGLVALGSTPR